MKIMLLNQYGPDSGAPTGRILGELSQELAQSGHQVKLITTGQKYGGTYRGGRILREAFAHLKIAWQGLLTPKVDAIISLTSPGCLPVTATLLCWRHGARHYHWAMDIYPDVGVELGEIRNPVLVAFLRALMKRAYLETCVIALDQDMGDYLEKHYQTPSNIIAPTPPLVEWPTAQPKERCWLYSGNFGRAHEITVLLQAQQTLEARNSAAWLILQGHGAQFESTKEIAHEMGLQQIAWRPPVPFHELGGSLLAADILVVTRKKEIKGILSPSKLVLAELSGRTILWIGDTDSHTAQALKENGHGVFRQEDLKAMTKWLWKQFDAPRREGNPQPVELLRRKIMDDWHTLLNTD